MNVHSCDQCGGIASEEIAASWWHLVQPNPAYRPNIFDFGEREKKLLFEVEVCSLICLGRWLAGSELYRREVDAAWSVVPDTQRGEAA